MQSVWVKRQKNEYDFPSHFISEYCDKAVCDQHGYKYDPDDNLIRERENVIVYNETGDTIYETIVVSRRTLGKCNYRQQYEGNMELIWQRKRENREKG